MANISAMLADYYQMLTYHLEGKLVKKIIAFTESSMSMLLEDDTIIHFQNVEDELLFDIELP
ncbi:hypothetical protein [Syntrophomonas erecta]